ISIALIIGFVLILGFPLIKWILGLVVPASSLKLALLILPFALLSLWLTTITSVFQSGLDGLQRIYIRNILMIGGSVFYAILCFIFAPKYGLIGLAYAQIINNSLILIVSWILIKRFLPPLPIIPYQWNKNLFKEIISYGVNFQVVSVTTMFYDPTTKVLLSKFGGLSMVGYYEMANRMIQQFRALIVSANQVLVPAIADLNEKNPERIRSVYLTSYNLLFYLALPLYTLIIISIPFISEIWIGHYERVFIIFGMLLAIGNFLNTLAGPSYFANLGTGELRWNVIGHIAIAILNAVFGITFGFHFNGYGVAVAWILALSLGSAVIYIAYHLTHKIPLSELFPNDSRTMFVFCILITLVSLLIQSGVNHTIRTVALNIIIILLSSILILIPLYLHPMRKRMMGWVRELLVRGG
ncbi:oligosaccharide flippase family protein, partial [Caldisericum sp.]|uniref:oligosaccharide flippase family protein n=1 Tax=Caldisericum sp. TaxID=2499687 RepID=UPI003D0F7C47